MRFMLDVQSYAPIQTLTETVFANILTLTAHTQELARNYPIGIPSYFGLIIRAFGTLEGLGLSMDPRYSIVKECFPYLARRLLTEDTPRMRKMLKSFLYGKDGTVLQV
jgi:predicted unusual protein kinase regulating ubiquinone biosynthesis (AarF/ABC1/UbiB family)